MAKETLFRILLRQPWWVTLLVAFGIFGVARAIFPPVAPFIALPFAGLAVYIAYRQFRGSAPVDAAERLAEMRAMSWEEFSAVLVDAYRRDGYSVAPGSGRGFDFTLTRDGRVTLLQCRRWKVNQVGAGPVRELADAVSREDASRGILVAAGQFSAPAQKATSTEPISLVSGVELVELVGRIRRKKAAST